MTPAADVQRLLAALEAAADGELRQAEREAACLGAGARSIGVLAGVERLRAALVLAAHEWWAAESAGPAGDRP